MREGAIQVEERQGSLRRERAIDGACKGVVQEITREYGYLSVLSRRELGTTRAGSPDVFCPKGEWQGHLE
jgi:hypothetical protein